MSPPGMTTKWATRPGAWILCATSDPPGEAYARIAGEGIAGGTPGAGAGGLQCAAEGWCRHRRYQNPGGTPDYQILARPGSTSGAALPPRASQERSGPQVLHAAGGACPG